MRNQLLQTKFLLLLLALALVACSPAPFQDNNGNLSLNIDDVLPTLAKQEVDDEIASQEGNEQDALGQSAANNEQEKDDAVDEEGELLEEKPEKKKKERKPEKDPLKLALKDYFKDPEHYNYYSGSDLYLREDKCRLWKFQVHWGNINGLPREKQKSLWIDQGSIIPADNALVQLINTVKFDRPWRDFIYKDMTDQKGIHFKSFVKPHFDGLTFYHISNCGGLSDLSESDENSFSLSFDDKVFDIKIPNEQYRYSDLLNIDDANFVIVDGHIVRPKCNDKMLVGNLRQNRNKKNRHHLNGFVLRSKIKENGKVRGKKLGYYRSFFNSDKEGLVGRIKNHKKKNVQKVDGKYALDDEVGYFKAISYKVKRNRKDKEKIKRRNLIEGSMYSQSDFERGIFRGFMADIKCERKLNKESR